MGATMRKPRELFIGTALFLAIELSIIRSNQLMVEMMVYAGYDLWRIIVIGTILWSLACILAAVFSAWVGHNRWIYRNIYLRTPYWRWIRKQVAERADYKCQAVNCLDFGKTMDAHHTTYRIMLFEWLFLKKMVYLCRFHHNITHNHQTIVLRDGRMLRPFGHKFPKGAKYV